jgi:hypothetical protein
MSIIFPSWNVIPILPTTLGPGKREIEGISVLADTVTTRKRRS